MQLSLRGPPKVRLDRLLEPSAGFPKAPVSVRSMHRSEMCASMPAHLERSRVVAHGASSEHGRYYDMLRTQVLQEMDKKSWQFLAVTSPTAGCGKSVTACNLAMSIARLPERSVLLVDLDLRKPMVANYLGIESNGGVLSVLEGRATFMRPSCKPALVRTTSWFFLGQCRRRARPNGWLPRQWVHFCKRSKESSGRALLYSTCHPCCLGTM